MVITRACEDGQPNSATGDAPQPLARPTLPRLDGRLGALRGRPGALAWLYALVPVPLVAEWIENGGPPTSPREWLPHACAGVVIAWLVARVRRDRRALEALARTDGLTGLFNRRSFEVAIEVECARARRSREPLSVVYLDIDDFKGINDRFGHAVGDQVLRQLAVAIEATIRARVDTAFRVGGDEFALLLPASTREQAAAVVARIRSSCAVREPDGAVGAFEFSAGVVGLEAGETAQALLARGDRAMYDDKTIRRAASA
jgi:diguanylate cyclase (GGDEF)-like protein